MRSRRTPPAECDGSIQEVQILENSSFPSVFFSDVFSGAGEEEEEEGEEQNRRRQVPQQEEGEDGVSAEGSPASDL